MMNSLRSLHWPATTGSRESSIKMARRRLSSRRQSAICRRSLPLRSSTSSRLISGGTVFFLPTAVTVKVTFPDSAASAGTVDTPKTKAEVASVQRSLEKRFDSFMLRFIGGDVSFLFSLCPYVGDALHGVPVVRCGGMGEWLSWPDGRGMHAAKETAKDCVESLEWKDS